MKTARELALEIVAKRGTPDFAICALNNAEAVAHALLGKQRLTGEPAASVPVTKAPRNELGRAVRLAWIKWAKSQPSPKPSWLVPYEALNEADKEVDRQIGEYIEALTMERLALLAASTGARGQSPPGSPSSQTDTGDK